MAEVQKQFSLFFSGTRLLVDGRIPDMDIFGFLFCCAAVFGPGSGADVRFSRFKKKFYFKKFKKTSSKTLVQKKSQKSWLKAQGAGGLQ